MSNSIQHSSSNNALMQYHQAAAAAETYRNYSSNSQAAAAHQAMPQQYQLPTEDATTLQQLATLMRGIKNLYNFVFSGGQESLSKPLAIAGQEVVATRRNPQTGEGQFVLSNGQVVSERALAAQDTGFIGDIYRFVTDVQDYGGAIFDKDILQTIGTVARSWDELDNTQRLQLGAGIALEVLQRNETIGYETAGDIQTALNAIDVLADGNASTSQQVAAVGSALAAFGTTSYTGTVDIPDYIGGERVVGSTEVDGEAGFLLENGQSVPRSEILSTYNVATAINALAVLTSGADTEDQVAALVGLGVDAGLANDFLSQNQASGAMAALGAYNTFTNWDNMSDVQRITATLNTGQSIANYMGYQTGALGGAASVVGAAAGIVMGVDQAADVIDAVEEMPRSQALKPAVVGMSTAGAAIGAGVAVVGAAATAGSMAAAGATIGSSVPVVGTIIGAAVGALIGVGIGLTGSGKGTGQKMRDAWRDGLEQMGIAHKVDGSHHVTLADGSTYNIGYDGGHKLQNVGLNVDGKTERHTFDVDWSNKVAVDSIPEGHVFAIATGLDPTSNKDHGLFGRAMAQGLNAATSNATSVEDVRENYRAMITQAGMQPQDLAMRIETLRLGNKITDQEYKVYLHHMNQIFGTQIQPTERDKAAQFLVEQLASQPRLEGPAKELFEILTSQEKQAESQKKLDERLAEGEKKK